MTKREAMKKLQAAFPGASARRDDVGVWFFTAGKPGLAFPTWAGVEGALRLWRQ